jgi:hypothetical protein
LETRGAYRQASGKRGAKNDQVNGERKKAFGFFLEIRDAIPDRRIDNGFAAERMRNGLMVALEQELIDAVVLIEHAQGRFQTLGQGVHSRSFQAFVIDTANFNNDTDLPRFRKEDMRSDKAKEIDHGIE